MDTIRPQMLPHKIGLMGEDGITRASSHVRAHVSAQEQMNRDNAHRRFAWHSKKKFIGSRD